MADFWSQSCPSRVGLRHAHWDKCRPDGVHPHDASGNEGTNHTADMCCHCQMTAAMYKAAEPAIAIPSVVRTDSTPVEPRAIDPKRIRPLVCDLTPNEMFRLAINCIEAERRRGYR